MDDPSFDTTPAIAGGLAAPVAPPQLPSWDEAMAQRQPKALPTWDEAMAAKKMEQQPHPFDIMGGAVPPQGLDPGAGDRILSAFGQSAFDTATAPLTATEETRKALAATGVWKPYTEAHQTITTAIRDGILRPAAELAASATVGTVGLGELGLHALSAPFVGASAAIGQVGKEIGGQPERFLRDVAGLPEAFPAFGAEIGLVHARSLGIIGEDDPPTLEQIEARHEAIRRLAPAQELPREAPPAPPVAEAPPAEMAPGEAPVAAVQDIHSAARQVAPEVFTGPNGYDALTDRKQTFSRWIDELATARDQAATADIDQRIADTQSRLDDATGRRLTTYRNRLGDLQNQRTQALDAANQDTPAMAKVRQDLVATDERMRDLAVDVSAAYRKAREGMPEEPEPTPEPAVAEPVPAQPEPAAAAEAAPVESAAPAAPAQAEPVAAPVQSIADDVGRQLVAAGRPEEEAQATGAVVDAIYRSWAARMPELGSAEEIYSREGPRIEASAAQQREMELAQRQGQTLDQARRGSITIREGQNIIRVMQKADASTAIHELGHNWLEELTRFSARDDAAADVKTDAKTVRDWLGVNDGEAIPTRAHEKFARGFERYMMEGVAPSRGLAGVFAKFKDWLTQIYQTVAKLRSPITDDIRQVFDRMLASGEEKPIIAPEREATPGLDERHSAIADKLIADAIAKVKGINSGTLRLNVEQMREEADDFSALHGVEGKTGERPSEGGEPDGGEPGGRPQPGPKGGGEAVGGVGKGGDKGAEQSPGTGTGGAGRNAARGTGGEAPISPGAKFTGSDSGLVDKAGNIRLDLLNTTDDIDTVLRETARDNDDFMAQRRGILSNGLTLELADALGMDPAMLDQRKIGQAFNAEQIIASVKLLIQSAGDVRSAAIAGNPAVYAEVKARHQMIQGHVSGLTAEAGRALQIFQSFKRIPGYDEAKGLGDFLRDEDNGKTLFQLEDEMRRAGSLKTPQQVSKFIDDSRKARFKNYILQYYINALISGPITHARYAVGNALNALWTPLVELPVAATVGSIKEALGSEAERVEWGEVGAQLYAFGPGTIKGWNAATEAFRTGVSPALPGEKAYSAQFLDSHTPIPGPIGVALNVPSRSVAAIHSFFKSLRYEQNIQGLAYRQASKEGLEGSQFDDRIAKLTQDPTPEMIEYATAQEKERFAMIEGMQQAATSDALKELFMAPTDYHSFSGLLTRAANANLAAKIVVPFMKIGTQITRNAFIERTPLGIFSQDIRDNLMGRNGGAAQSMQIAKMTTGTALVGITTQLAAEGLMTGDGPTDPAKRNMWLLTHKPNHITIGSISVPYQGLGHLGMLMRFGANMYETARGWEEGDGENLAVSFMEGITRSVLDENWMRGVKDMTDAIYHPKEYGERWLVNNVTNWMPYSVGLGQVSRVVDPYMRQTNGVFPQDVFNAAQDKIPVVSEGLYPRRDVFGAPIPNAGPLPDYKNDPTVHALDDANVGIGKLEDRVLGVKLTPEQYDAYSANAGMMTKFALDQLVNVPGWESQPKGIRRELIKNAVDEARKGARQQLILENLGGENDILHKSTEATLESLQ